MKKIAIIYQQQNANNQYTSKKNTWILAFQNDEKREYQYEAMNWHACENTSPSSDLKFDELEKAIRYADKNSIEYEILQS